MTAAAALIWTERQMQDAVYIHCMIKNHEIIIPNSCLFAWESDVLSVNKTGFISEFEIKVSRADFKQDAKKERAQWLVNPAVSYPLWGDRTIEKTVSRPNYFYYVVPVGLIEAAEVPDYAGLIYVRQRVNGPRLFYSIAQEVKPAKRLHRDKITQDQLRQLARATNRRYWQQRLKTITTEAEQ